MIATKNLVSGAQNNINLNLANVAGAKPIGMVGIKDINANNTPDIALLYTNMEGKAAMVQVVDSQTGAKIKTINLVDTQLVAVDIEMLPDLNRNGFEEISILRQTPSATGLIDIIDTKTNAVIARRNY